MLAILPRLPDNLRGDFPDVQDCRGVSLWLLLWGDHVVDLPFSLDIGGGEIFFVEVLYRDLNLFRDSLGGELGLFH